jgi:HAE1 family hydrophobic/amphiphilic exporter-1
MLMSVNIVTGSLRKAAAAAFLIVAAMAILFGGAIAQTPTPTPSDAMPVSPAPKIPVRPMPSSERVGVDAGRQLSLTLPQAIEMALKNNNDIDASRNTSRISEFNIKAALGIYDPLVTSENYYEKVTTPTASAIGGAVNGAVNQKRFYDSIGVSGLSPFQGGSYTSQFNASRVVTSNTNSFLNPQFPSTFTFSYVQPLLRNRRFDNSRRQIEISKKNLLLTDSQLQMKAMDVVSSTESAYWDLTYSLRNLQVQIETLKQAKDQLESNQRLVAKGVLAPIDIVAATAQITTLEQGVFAAQESVTRAENTLKTLLLPARTAAEWSQPIVPVTPVNIDVPAIGLEVAVTEALKNRPELTQMDIASDLNKIDQRFYRDQMKPEIDFVGTYTSQGLAGTVTAAAISQVTGLSRVPPNLNGGYLNSLGNLIQQDYPTYHFGVTISLPFGNHVAKANLGAKLAEADRIRDQREQQEQSIEADVRNSLQALRSAQSKLTSAADARAAAEELYESEQRQFRGGTTTYFLVAQRQNDLLTARGREIQARTDLNKAISTFNRAIGASLTVNNVTVVK